MKYPTSPPIDEKEVALTPRSIAVKGY